MFRSKRNKDTPQPEAAAPRAPMPSSGYQSSELMTYDGKGHPQIVVYTRDAQGRTIKTMKKVRRAK